MPIQYWSDVAGAGPTLNPIGSAVINVVLFIWSRHTLAYPADTRRWINVGLTLVQRRMCLLGIVYLAYTRRWINVGLTLVQRRMCLLGIVYLAYTRQWINVGLTLVQRRMCLLGIVYLAYTRQWINVGLTLVQRRRLGYRHYTPQLITMIQ